MSAHDDLESADGAGDAAPAPPALVLEGPLSTQESDGAEVAEPPPRRRRLHWLVAAAVLLGGAGAGAFAWKAKQPSQYHPATAAAWPPGTADIVSFVERTRGLHFTHPVPVDFLTSDQFTTRMRDRVKVTPTVSAHLDTVMHLYRAVGLEQGQIDLAKARTAFESQEVIGVYDGVTGHLWVRGRDLTPFVRTTMAHELTHALQDETFHIFDRGRHMTPDQQQAFQALYEGDATAVEQAYAAQLTDADKAAYRTARAAMNAQADLSAVPQQLSDDALTPYTFGSFFVAAMRAEGGTNKLNEAFQHPPTSLDQITDPASYDAPAPPPLVPPKLHPGERQLKTVLTFTKLDLVEIVGDRLGYDTAVSGLTGWERADARPFSTKTADCVRVDILTTYPAELAALLSRWAQADGQATASRQADTVELTACDPGPTATHPPASPRPFSVYALRSAFITSLVKAVNLPKATCIADDAITHVGAATLVADNQLTDPHDPRITTLQRAVATAATRCA